MNHVVLCVLLSVAPRLSVGKQQAAAADQALTAPPAPPLTRTTLADTHPAKPTPVKGSRRSGGSSEQDGSDDPAVTKRDTLKLSAKAEINNVTPAWLSSTKCTEDGNSKNPDDSKLTDEEPTTSRFLDGGDSANGSADHSENREKYASPQPASPPDHYLDDQ